MSFSQRKGFKPASKTLQLDSMDAELRNGLWSCYYEIVLKQFQGPEDYPYGPSDKIIGSNLAGMFERYWLSFFKKATDTIPYDIQGVTEVLRKFFFGCKWYEVYDFIEFSLEILSTPTVDRLRSSCNAIMERENAGYRIIETTVIDITDTTELAEVDAALSSPFGAVRQHLEAALTLLADRKSPDYRNSIKESISAVESIARCITGDRKATLGAALTLLESRISLHAALKAAFSSLYGYTSDQGGIRHAMLEEPNLTSSDAKFMLVACSAFVNYLTGKAVEAGVKLPTA